MAKNISALPFDFEQKLGEATTVTASGVIGVAALNLKSLGFNEGTVVVNVTASDDTSADETYVVTVELSTDEAFTAPIAVAVRTLTRGVLGQQFIPMNNQGEVMYQYLRLNSTLSGTTPSLTVDAYLSESIKR
jgi:hypothetical protein